MHLGTKFKSYKNKREKINLSTQYITAKRALFLVLLTQKEINYQKKTLQQSRNDHTIDQNHFVNNICNTYYPCIIWIWTNNGAHFTLAFQYLSEDTLDVCHRGSSGNASEENLVYWNDIMWGFTSKRSRKAVRENCRGHLTSS